MNLKTFCDFVPVLLQNLSLISSAAVVKASVLFEKGFIGGSLNKYPHRIVSTEFFSNDAMVSAHSLPLKLLGSTISSGHWYF